MVFAVLGSPQPVTLKSLNQVDHPDQHLNLNCNLLGIPYIVELVSVLSMFEI